VWPLLKTWKETGGLSGTIWSRQTPSQSHGLNLQLDRIHTKALQWTGLDDDILTHLYEKLRAKWVRGRGERHEGRSLSICSSSNSFLAPGRVVGYRGMGPGSLCPDFQTKHSMTPSPPQLIITMVPACILKDVVLLIGICKATSGQSLIYPHCLIKTLSTTKPQPIGLNQIVWTLYKDCCSPIRTIRPVHLMWPLPARTGKWPHVQELCLQHIPYKIIDLTCDPFHCCWLK
jgi:hypothetical protein